MSRDTPDDDADEGGPRLIQVAWSGFGAPDGVLLHRLDDAAACSSQPLTNPSTDLETASVHDGNDLCSRCEWPDGAREVLESDA